jgi:hypothetical protein
VTDITREEFDAFKADITARLDRIETKLDENIKCQRNKVSRDECGEHRDKVWTAIDGARRFIYIGLGLAIAVEVIVLPILFVLLRK